jgi:hypothetical protein
MKLPTQLGVGEYWERIDNGNHHVTINLRSWSQMEWGRIFQARPEEFFQIT